jgi:hypothetical protein
MKKTNGLVVFTLPKPFSFATDRRFDGVNVMDYLDGGHSYFDRITK